MINIDNEKCIKCGACAAVCPTLVIESSDGGMETVYKDSCFNCYHCVAVCPEGAISCDEFPLEEFKIIKGGKEITASAAERFLMSRRSVREFRNKPVPQELLEKLTRIALHAPTGHNAQAVEMSVITNRALIDKLDLRIMKKFITLMSLADHPVGEAVVKMFAGSKTSESLSVSAVDFKRFMSSEGRGKHHIFRGAPALIVAHGGPAAMTGKEDCIIALSHAMFAAQAHGLGATWIGFLAATAIFDPGIKKRIGVPPANMVHGSMILGWPKYTYKRIIPRKGAPVKWIG